MYRWNSRGYNNTSSNSSKSNLSENSSTSIISARGWIWNALKTFFSLFSVFHFRRILQKLSSSCELVVLSKSTSFLNSSLCCCYSTTTKNNSTPPSSVDTAKETIDCPCSKTCSTSSSQRSNCNIPGAKNKSKPKMAQFLSKTMTLLGVAFVIHFIIMSTFAEREGNTHGSSSHSHSHLSDSSRHRSIRRQQRSFRSEKHTAAIPEENTLAPTRFLNRSDAIFFTENTTVITAQTGSKTYLPCAVRNPGSAVASWIRRRDYTILTVGMGTYSNDDRFVVSHNRAAQSWELHIKLVKESDEGIYECQITTHPPSSIFIRLNVVEAEAEILGEPDKHVRSGSTFELVCVLRNSTEPPVYVFWYHNDRMINYDNVRGVVVNSDTEKSILTIQDAQKTDSGNYSCVPSNAKSTSISVHILNGEKPAAMQHGSRNQSGKQVPYSLRLLFITLFAIFIGTTLLITMSLDQNMFYLRQPTATPLVQQIETNVQNKEDCQTGIVSSKCTQQEQKEKASIVEYNSIPKYCSLLQIDEERTSCLDKEKIRFEKTIPNLPPTTSKWNEDNLRVVYINDENGSANCQTYNSFPSPSPVFVTSVEGRDSTPALKLIGDSYLSPIVSSCVSYNSPDLKEFLSLPLFVDFIASWVCPPLDYILYNTQFFLSPLFYFNSKSSLDFDFQSEKNMRPFVPR